MGRPLRTAAPKKDSLREADTSDEEESPQEQESEDKELAVLEKPKPQPKRRPVQTAATRRKQAIVEELDPKLALLEVLVRTPSAAPAAAKAWVVRYQDASVQAVAELLTLLAQVAGVSVPVSEAEVEDCDVDELATRLAKSAIKDGCGEPLTDRRTARTLVDSLGVFISSLVSTMDEEELLAGSTDDYGMERFTHTVMAINNSPVRPFRLAATHVAAHLVGALVELRKKRSASLATVQFQHETEAKKGRATNQVQLGSLKHSLDAYKRQVEVLGVQISELIKTVFAVRFRDVHAPIRALVISSIGSWVQADPANFLADTHLKYLGWALCDQDAEVRLGAVNALTQLYQTPAHVLGLRDLKARFLNRLMELPYDVDERVAIRVLPLLTQLVELREVDPIAMRGLAGLLCDDSPELCGGVCTLLAGVLKHQAEVSLAATLAGDVETPHTVKGKGRTGSKAKSKAMPREMDADKALQRAEIEAVLDLLAFMQMDTQDAQLGVLSSQQDQPEAHLEQELVQLLVSGLFDNLLSLHNVGYLAGLLALPEVAEGKLGGSSSVHLAMLLAESMHRISENAVSKPTAKGKKSKQADSGTVHQEATLSLLGLLPGLVRQYQTEPFVVLPLLRCVDALCWDIFALREEEQTLGTLLGLVADQVLRHTDRDVLLQSADVLVHTVDKVPGALKAAAQLALERVVSKVGAAVASAAKVVLELADDEVQAQVDELEQGMAHGWLMADVPASAEALWQLHVALLRASTLLSRGVTELAAHDAIRSTVPQLLADATSVGRTLNVGCVATAMGIMQAALMYRVEQIIQSGPDATAQPSADILAVENAEITPTRSAPKQGVSKGTRSRKGFKPQNDTAASDDSGDEEGGRRRDGATVQVEDVAARVQQLHSAVAEHGKCLIALFDAVQEDGHLRDVVLGAISDYLVIFGVNSWQGTPAAGVGLEVSIADQLLQRCCKGCTTTLATKTAEAALLAPDVDELDDEVVAAGTLAAYTNLAERIRAVGQLVRLLLTPTALQPKQHMWLAVMLIPEMSGNGPEVEQLLREAVLALRKRQLILAAQKRSEHEAEEEEEGGAEDRDTAASKAQAKVLITALKYAYRPVFQESKAQVEALNQELSYSTDGLHKVLIDFGQVGEAMATLYGAPGVHREELLSFVRAGVHYALTESQDPRPTMYFLAWGLTKFTAKLTPGDAALVLEDLDECMAQAEQRVPRVHALEDEEETPDPCWAQVDHYREGLQARSQTNAAARAKGAPRGALKGSRARAAAVKKGKGVKRPRSKAAQEQGSEEQPQTEQEEEEAEPVEQLPRVNGVEGMDDAPQALQLRPRARFAPSGRAAAPEIAVYEVEEVVVVQTVCTRGTPARLTRPTGRTTGRAGRLERSMFQDDVDPIVADREEEEIRQHQAVRSGAATRGTGSRRGAIVAVAPPVPQDIPDKQGWHAVKRMSAATRPALQVAEDMGAADLGLPAGGSRHYAESLPVSESRQLPQQPSAQVEESEDDDLGPSEEEEEADSPGVEHQVMHDAAAENSHEDVTRGSGGSADVPSYSQQSMQESEPPPRAVRRRRA